MGFGALLCGAKLLDYQVFNADEYRQQADYRRLSHQTLFAKRGTVYDRNGNVLASSVECQNVYVNPQLIESKRKAVNALVDILGVDAAVQDHYAGDYRRAWHQGGGVKSVLWHSSPARRRGRVRAGACCRHALFTWTAPLRLDRAVQ